MLTIILFGIIFQTTKINQAACDLAKEVAREGGVYFAGCINQTASLYSQGAGKDEVMKKFREQIEIFLQNNVDLIIAEVSCLKLHLNLNLKLTMQIHSSVLISALELSRGCNAHLLLFPDYLTVKTHLICFTVTLFNITKKATSDEHVIKLFSVLFFASSDCSLLTL